MSKQNHKLNLNPSTSYYESLNHLLYIPGIGHVAPDTYSGYGSLLDSDVDDENEATSAYRVESDTIVPDSLFEEVTDCACVGEDGISLDRVKEPSLSSNTKKFNRFCANFFDKQRKISEKRVIEAKAADKKRIRSDKSVELSTNTKKFNAFYEREMERLSKKS